MSLARKVAFNSLIQISGRFIAIFLGILLFGIMGRYLGPTRFGNYTTIVSFLQFFAILSEMGLTLSTLQMISKPQADEEKIINNVLTLKTILNIFFLTIAVISVFFFPYPKIVKIGTFIFAFSFLFVNINPILSVLFQKKLQITKVTLVDLINKSLLLIFVIIIIYLKLGLLSIIAGGVITAFLSSSFLLHATSKFIKLKLEFDFPFWKKIIQKSWPIALSIAFNLIYLKTDTIILSLFYDQKTVGLYGVAFQFFEILLFVPTMLMGLILPIMTYTWTEKNLKKFKKIFKTTFDIIISMAIPLTVGAYFLAEKIIILIVGKDFIASAPILKIIVLASSIVFIGTFYGHIIVAINKQKQMVWGYAVTAIIGLLIYLTLIPKFSYYGAAWGTVITETIIASICFYFITKNTKIWPDFSIIFKVIIASLMMGCFLYYFKEKSIYFLLPSAGIIYLITLYLIGGVKKELIQEILKNE